MRAIICCFVVFFLVIFGCAGRQPNPVPLYIPGDEDRSCDALKDEIVELQEEMTALLPKTNKFGTNALWAAGGVFFIVPYFFIDLKDAERIEFDAMRLRHNRLIVYAQEKTCEMTGVRVERIPSLDERRGEAKKILHEPDSID